jgi:hypothetical protein
LVLLLVFALVSALPAQPALEQARRAQLLLGGGTWSQIIRVENQTRLSRYARTVFALVFEFQGVLWFYTDADGTQSFSLHYGALVAEKADFGPLLRAIDPGFARWSVVDDAALAHVKPSPKLRNGCFIESLALWRERVARGEPLDEPRLLSYYYEPSLRRSGHTVFAYREGDALKLVDPFEPGAVHSIPNGLAGDALGLAREHGGRAVWKARYLKLDAPALPTLVAG